MEATISAEKLINTQSNVFEKLNVNDALMGLFLFFLPFTQALTINFFFPLKLSEIFIVIYAAINLKMMFNIKLSANWAYILLFLIIVLTSLVINIFTSYPYSLDVSNVRLNKNLDSILKYFYLLIAFLSMLAIHDVIKRKPGLVNFLFLGTTVAASYCWYISVSSVLHIPYLLLPGMDNPPQVMFTSIGEVVRCGTAKEGNFMGFFLLIAGTLAMHFNKKKKAVFYFLTILTTFSSIASVTALLFIFLILIHDKKVNIFKRYLILISLFTITTISFLSSADIRIIIYNKIFGNEDTVTNYNDVYSKYDRLNSSLVGYQIFKADPILGVGLANYGLHFEHYNDLPMFDITNSKRIPNNIYIELLSETGVISTIFFLLFLYYLYKLCKKYNTIYLKYGMVVSFIYFAAFPTYTMLFIWVFFGIISTLEKSNSSYNETDGLIKTLV